MQAMKMLAAARRVRNVRRWMRWVGWRGTFDWAVTEAKSTLGLRGSPTLTIKPRNAQHSLVARLGGSSDMSVFSQIFAWDEYGCIRSVPSPRWIFDLGANVGYASAYLLSCFPTARAIAVEPDPANYALCCENLAPYGDRVRVVHGAVWSTRTRLKLLRGSFGDNREWATQVAASVDGEGTIEAYDIPTLLKMTDGGLVDVLKIDIERSELEVFRGRPAWLAGVRNICIELHGADCESIFFEALRGYQFSLARSGELTLCLNLRSSE